MSHEINARSTAVILVDFINEMVAEGGKLTGKGYREYVVRHRTDEAVARLVTFARGSGLPVIHVRVGFSAGYVDHPKGSPLFGGAKNAGALALGSWATEFAEFARPSGGELVVTKHRVSSFYGTDLEVALRTMEVNTILVAGCATDLAVQSAVRDAHDRDFKVLVVADACAAASDADHANSLTTLGKIATICTTAELRVEDR